MLPLRFLETKVDKIDENAFKITLVYEIEDKDKNPPNKQVEQYLLVSGEAARIDEVFAGSLKEKKKELFNLLFDRLKDYILKEKADGFLELEQKVNEAVEQAKEEWVNYKKAMGLKYEVVEAKLPPKSKVFIEKRIDAISTKKYTIMIGSTQITYYARTPKESQEIDDLIFDSPKSGVEYILSKLGKQVNIGADVEAPTANKIPYLMIYKLDDGVGLSYNPLPTLGKVDARLYPLTRQKLDELKAELGRDYDKLIRSIQGALKIGSGKKEDEEGGEDEELLREIARHVYIIETGLRDSEVRRLLNDLPEFLKLWNSIEADPFIKEFYRAMILPWFTPAYLPHTLLITPTNTGKSSLYEWAIGEKALTDVSPITLAGGIDPDTRKVFLGILHGRDKAIQIESLESNTARETVSLLVNYMKSGSVRRGVAGKVFETEGSSPLILTGNPHKVGRAYRLQDWLNKGLLKEPQPLGSRLLLFYLEEAKPLKYIDNAYSLLEPLREIASSSLIKRELRKVWDNPRIKSWLREGDKPIELSIGLGKELGDLSMYIETLAREYHVRLKALALNNVLVDYLDKPDEKIEEILDKAVEKYKWFKQYLAISINTALAEHGKAVSETARAKLLPELLIKLLICIDAWLNAKAINIKAVDNGIIPMPVKELLDIMKSKGLIGDYPVYGSRVRKYLKDNAETLEELGIVYSEATDTILVNIHRFSMINTEELARELEK